MNEDYSVSLPFSEQELQEILHEGKSFEWIFPTNENENVNITIHIITQIKLNFNQRCMRSISFIKP